jgi:hypothetical protein
VIQRVKKRAVVVSSRLVGSWGKFEKKSRTWSSDMMIITTPLRRSMESSLPGLGTV